MTIFSKRFLFVIIFLVTAFAVAYFSSDVLLGSGMRSDEELKTVYFKNRDSFTKLERLFVDDPTLRYASSSKFHRNDGRGLGSDSKPPDEYRSIFDQTGILFGIRDGVIDLRYLALATVEIPLDSGTDSAEKLYEEKGYALILTPDEKILELLGTGKTYGNVEFKQIEQHWYIYHRITVSKPE